MEHLRGDRAQEQAQNLGSGSGTSRAHEAAEGHRGAPAVIAEVDPDGEGAAAGLVAGDEVLEVDGEPVRDVLEFTYQTMGESSLLVVRRGEETFAVELPGLGPAGLTFERELFDGVRRCNNNCVFCFVHQLPRQGLRRSLMVKDEDYRLSFLHGGYVTMGNFTEDDWDRVLTMRLSPLYVSVHCTDREARNRMLGNPDAPCILEGLGRLAEGGIDVHAQIVLVPGYNDGALLTRTLADLTAQANVRSVAVVPVGLTDHRKNLPDLRALTPAEAAAAVDQVEASRAADQDASGPRIFGGDELYQLAGRDLPEAGYYGEGYPLREDGVGMIRSFEDGLEALAGELEALGPAPRPGRVAVVTGVAAAPLFRRAVMPALRGLAGVEAELLVVENDFFGHGITVAGLLTSRDIAAAVQAAGAFDRVLVGEHAFQPGGDVMLDGPGRAELAEACGAEVVRVPDHPGSLVDAARGVSGELGPAPAEGGGETAVWVTKAVEDNLLEECGDAAMAV